jgi:hypothetical protein
MLLRLIIPNKKCVGSLQEISMRRVKVVVIRLVILVGLVSVALGLRRLSSTGYHKAIFKRAYGKRTLVENWSHEAAGRLGLVRW